jgi:CBS domain containing-hemolysin-like protein
VAALGALIAVATAGAGGALVSPEGRQPTGAEDTHRALAMARVLAYLALGAGTAWGVRRAMPEHAWQALVVIAVIGAVLVLDAVVREAAVDRGPAVAGQLRWFTSLVAFALRPLVRLGRRVEAALNRLIPPQPDNESEREQTADRLRALLEPKPSMPSADSTLLHRAFALADTGVDEIMAPRVDIVGVDSETPWSEVLDRVRSSEHARLPVYHETLDEVVGILYAKDLLAWALRGEEPEKGWISLVRPASFIPATKTIDRQLREFRKSGTHIAIVVDEFGGTAGLVTIEDVLEEIVGEIRDERDIEEPDIEREGNDRFWVRGRVPLSDLSDVLGASLERDDVSTVGGLVYDAFGHVPRPGDSRRVGEFKLVVESVRRRRVERVYFERVRASAGARSGDA